MSEHHVIDLSRLASVRDGTGHSIFGASGSGMFLNCPGSLIPNLLTKDEGNPDAAYGSIAHMVTEEWLKTGVRPDHLLDTTHTKDGFEILIDDIMFDHAKECVDRCVMLDGDHLIEEHVDYSDLTPIPRQGGTLDFAAMQDGFAVVVDHKFGKHEQVFAANNSQLMLYAYGLYRRYSWLYNFECFVIKINQPRLDHYDEWSCTLDDLLEFAEFAKFEMHSAWNIDAKRVPGEKQCKYCRVQSSCTANALQQVALIEQGVRAPESASTDEMVAFKERAVSESFDIVELDIGNLSTSHIASLHQKSKTAMRFWKSLSAELFKRAQAGEDLSPYGLKIVEGRALRAFGDTYEAEKVMVANGVPVNLLYEKKFVSPAKAEGLLKTAGVRRKDIPDLLGGLIVKPPGKPTLAPLADKREEIVDITNIAFGDESSETDE